MYFEEVLEISRLSSEPERSTGMLGVGLQLPGFAIFSIWFISSFMGTRPIIFIGQNEKSLELAKNYIYRTI
jgi:hypothetical protein